MTPEENFKRIVEIYGPRLQSLEFGFSGDDVSAIFGNAGHESVGMTKLQEMAPIVKGSRGGYGWMQWTGPRRRDYENFCAIKKLSPSDDEANFQFLVHELRNAERLAVHMVRKAELLTDKVEAFERAYERAGVKHYDRRKLWAVRAQNILRNLKDQPMTGTETKSATKSITIWGAIIAMLPTLLQLLGLDIDPAQATAVVQAIHDVVVNGLPILGGLIAIIGRLRASKKVVVGNPNKVYG